MKTPGPTTAFLGLLVVGRLAAQPVLVSPAGPGEPLAASACPTFSWGGAATGRPLEIVVFAIDSDGRAAAQPVIRQSLPAGATAWTPSADRCLSAGRHAWTVRAGDDDAGAPPAVFRVAEDSALRIRKLEEVIARLTAGPAAPAPSPEPEGENEDSPDAPRRGVHPNAPAGDLRWLAGAAFSPPACGAPDVFGDVDSSNPLCPWIEQAYSDGLSQGCGGGDYCPKNPVTREQIAVLLGKVHHADAGGDLTGSYPNPSLANSVRLPQSCGNNATAIWNGSTWNCGSPNATPVPFHVQAHGGHWGEIAGPGVGNAGETGVTGWGSTGVFGYGNGTGAWGETGLASGVGVRGNAWAGGVGVYGYSGGSNYGVLGESASGYGVYGTAGGIGGIGVYATAPSAAGATYGLFSTVPSTSGTAVWARATASSGGTYGARAWVDSPAGTAIEGIALSNTGSSNAVFARSYSTAGTGVNARGGLHGVFAKSDANTAFEAAVRAEGARAGVEATGSTGGIFLGTHTGGYFSGVTWGIYVEPPGCAGCATSGALSPAAPRSLPRRGLIATASGAHLTLGGTWVNSSDASLKENFSRVDAADLLRRLEDLPVQSWNYIADGAGIRHIGPTAQDFQAVFGLGGGDTTISTVDPAGIALAAIQELARRTEELKAKAREVDDLRRRVEELTVRLDRTPIR